MEGFVNGFLPDVEPLLRLSEYFEPLESIIDELPSLINERKLREKVHCLPLLTVSDTSLPTKQHWQRAYCVLSYISQGYIWEGGEDDMCDSLPKQLAIPLSDVSSMLGLPPSPCIALALWGWCLRNPNEKLASNNFKTMFSFTGTEDEEWFFLIHMRIELAAAPGINAVIASTEAIKKNDEQEVTKCLNAVAECISNATSILKEARVKCRPSIFYYQLRPFLSGSPTGLKYEGTSDPTAMKKYPGGSAVQSSIFPLFDMFLGIKFQSDAQVFLDKMRWHMPREHRQFLFKMNDELSSTSPREYVQLHSSNKEMMAAYNRCIKELTGFRQQHINVVTSYVIIPSQGKASSGTAGSDLINFLKKPRDGTATHKLQEY